jgi:heme exporter protein D
VKELETSHFFHTTKGLSLAALNIRSVRQRRRIRKREEKEEERLNNTKKAEFW